jgi:hypothetical protein
MAFEVVFSCALGGVVMADMRAALGPALDLRDSVHVVVLTAEGLVDATLGLVATRAGPGVRHALRCPGCGYAASILRAQGGVLRCARCRAHRTSRQTHRSTRWWLREGGEATDRLVRLAQQTGRRGRMQKMTTLATALVGDDERRLAALVPRVRSVLALEVP